MQIRVKMPLVILYILCGVGLVVFLIDDFRTIGFLDLYLWSVALCSLYIIPILIFLIPTFRIHLTEESITTTFKLGYGKLSIYNYHESMKWKDIRLVSNGPPPTWFPFHIYTINGLWMGSFLTKNKAALLYIADHVKPNVMDNEIRVLVEKYRRRQKRVSR